MALAQAGSVRAFVENVVAEGFLAIGVQLSVRHRGDEHLLIVGSGGTGGPLAADTRLRVYCAGKPMVALGAQVALAQAGHDLDQPIGTALGDVLAGFPDHVSNYTCRDLLVHQTTMLSPTGVDSHLFTEKTFLSECARHAQEFGLGSGYSEVTGWLLLSKVVEAVTGESAFQVIRRELVERLGLAYTTFGMTDEEVVAHASQVEPNVRLAGTERIPMLSDRSPRNLRRFEASYGGYSSASDLSRFYEWMLHPLGPDGAEDSVGAKVVDSMIWDQRERRHDPALNLECAFGRGVMVGLSDFTIGTTMSPSAFGHSGFIGTVYGFADPEHDLALGCVFIGITDADSTAAYLRPTLTNLIYHELLA